MRDETSAHRILAEVFPFFREGFIRSLQAIETTFLPSPIRRGSLRHRWPVIRSPIRFVEPALKPFCQIADGRIPALLAPRECAGDLASQSQTESSTYRASRTHHGIYSTPEHWRGLISETRYKM